MYAVYLRRINEFATHTAPSNHGLHTHVYAVYLRRINEAATRIAKHHDGGGDDDDDDDVLVDEEVRACVRAAF